MSETFLLTHFHTNNPKKFSISFLFLFLFLTHVCGTQKNGTDEPVCRAEVETQMQKTNVWTPRGESRGGGGDGGVMNWAIGIDMYTLMCIKLMTNKNLLYKKIKLN